LYYKEEREKQEKSKGKILDLKEDSGKNKEKFLSIFGVREKERLFIREIYRKKPSKT